MRRSCLLLLFIFLNLYSVLSQNTIGIPEIVNHAKEEYRAGNQNWDVTQDADGIMYFANNDGLLSYDGNFWRLYTLPNNVIARSVAVGHGRRIYVGGQEEFGYFSPSGNGDLVYTSLKSLIPQKDNDFADVWDICIFDKDVFFRSKKKIFRLSEGRITVYKSTDWGFLGSTHEGVFAYEFEKGLVAFRDGDWKPVLKPGSLPSQPDIRAMIDIGKDSLLVASFMKGLFILHDSVLEKFSTGATEQAAAANISGALLLEPDRLALITNLGGCIIVNRKGDFIQRFTKEEGLQNDNIQAIHLDKDNNCWLALDNGIDMLAYKNAITHIFPDDDRNAGYTSLLYKGRLYLGASTGLYSVALDSSRDLSFTKGAFRKVDNTKGQVWNLTEINGRLLVGHTKGAFAVDGNRAVPFDEHTGFWTFLPLQPPAQGPVPTIIAGTYNGINVYHYDGHDFVNIKVHAQFESAKFVALQDAASSVIWIAHSYKGLYKVTFNEQGLPQASIYHDSRHILSHNHNHLYRIRDRIVLTTDKGIFEYNKDSSDFIRSAWLTGIFGEIPITYIKEDPYSNLWFVTADKKAGVVDMSNGRQRLVFISQLDNLLMTGGYENINIIDSNNVLVAAEKGFFHINYAQYVKHNPLMRVLIRHVTSISREPGLQPDEHTFKYQGNSLHFEFSAPLYAQQQNIDYSYFLKGFDKEWSPWGKKPEKDYTNLPEGDYIFEVKCRNTVTNESSAVSYSFRVLPPWYRTWWAFVVYALATAGLLYWFYKRQQRKYKRLQARKLQEQQRKYAEEQQQLQIGHQLELSRNEKEIIQLKNDKLQGELEQKNKELAANAMSFVQKGELLSKIKEELMRMKNGAELEKDSKDFKKIIRIIDTEQDNPHDWEQFAVHFDSVHTNYLRDLKERFPDLTASELKLCAFLRLNLSSKEISQLMNISVRGVETSRYRLRKKLDLSADANLVDFLMTASS